MSEVEILAARLDEFVQWITKERHKVDRIAAMHVPAEPDSDGDLVMSRSAQLLRQQRDHIAALEALLRKASEWYYRLNGGPCGDDEKLKAEITRLLGEK